jgi:outer membrane protein assembly factor BamB
MKRNTICGALALATLSTMLFAAADWPQFLGPKGQSVSADKGLPVTWSATQNVVWKTAMPGYGGSCPIVLGDKIYLTAYSGYGIEKGQGSPENLLRHVLCLDAASGKIVWDKTFKAELPEQEYDATQINLHGYASNTPVTDGKSLYVFMGRSGVYALSLSGDTLWHAEVGSKIHVWGSGTSPILAGDLVIVNASIESGSVVALNKATGKEVWRVGDIVQSWSTPALLDLPGGKQELVVSLKGKVLGIDPATGRQLWTCDGVPDYVCPAVLTHGDIAYVTGGRKPFFMAIRGGGQGDVTKSHKLWEVTKTPKVPTPLYDNGYLYWVNDAKGIVCCMKADSGEVVYEERLGDLGVVYASLLLADGKLYGVSRSKGAFVLAAGPKFKELGRNDLGDSSIFNATPVPCQGHLLLRSDGFLYCLGK